MIAHWRYREPVSSLPGYLNSPHLALKAWISWLTTSFLFQLEGQRNSVLISAKADNAGAGGRNTVYVLSSRGNNKQSETFSLALLLSESPKESAAHVQVESLHFS